MVFLPGRPAIGATPGFSRFDMIYLVGGAPRVGKSILGQRIAAKLKIGWISTDLLWELLKAKNVEGTNIGWNATPEAIAATAEWFYPCLERFVWGVSALAESYIIEGVAFLPTQIAQLSAQYELRSVFLGCSKMTLERFDRFPGRSRGYASLPKEIRRQFAQDIPLWSEFVRQESERFGYPYVDMIGDFPSRLSEADVILTAGASPEGRDRSV
jgi:2-phosphoglycerate kinase